MAFFTQQNAPSSPLQRRMDKKSQFRHEPSRKVIGLRKDLSEVLAFVRLEGLTYRTLRGALSPNVKPRGRGQFQLLRLTFCWCTTFGAGDDTRDSKNPACHTCSRRFVCYSTDEEESARGRWARSILRRLSPLGEPKSLGMTELG